MWGSASAKLFQNALKVVEGLLIEFSNVQRRDGDKSLRGRRDVGAFCVAARIGIRVDVPEISSAPRRLALGVALRARLRALPRHTDAFEALTRTSRDADIQERAFR